MTSLTLQLSFGATHLRFIPDAASAGFSSVDVVREDGMWVAYEIDFEARGVEIERALDLEALYAQVHAKQGYALRVPVQFKE